jgi:hypothetical protein
MLQIHIPTWLKSNHAFMEALDIFEGAFLQAHKGYLQDYVAMIQTTRIPMNTLPSSPRPKPTVSFQVPNAQMMQMTPPRSLISLCPSPT